MQETTTRPHVCITHQPCGVNSNCVAIGEGADDYFCSCKMGYSGVDSTDGDGCHRTRITSAAANGRQGLYISVGEGADLHVRAGGPRRGREAGVLQMADDLEALLNDVQSNAAAVADTTATLGTLGASVGSLKDLLTDSITAVYDDLQVVINEQLTPAVAGIAMNTNAIADEKSRAIAAESSLFAATKQAVGEEQSRASAAENSIFAAAKQAVAEEQTRATAVESAFFIAAKLSKSCTKFARNHDNANADRMENWNAAVFDTLAIIYPTGSVLAPKSVWCRITPPRVSLVLVSQGKPTEQKTTCR